MELVAKAEAAWVTAVVTMAAAALERATEVEMAAATVVGWAAARAAVATARAARAAAARAAGAACSTRR